ncbi:hypothetical protein Bhyg_12205 [Pseudolycoriella hygida]|uniref:Uncharacterized protein n=1 Tax=Pseudolycoriella hygida TaxID=35572 RepID=A0A9Q0MX38_9DIPT|nr:hypothetical protein Bhyg_12205 [Pseudolycoriella hygida]
MSNFLHLRKNKSPVYSRQPKVLVQTQPKVLLSRQTEVLVFQATKSPVFQANVQIVGQIIEESTRYTLIKNPEFNRYKSSVRCWKNQHATPQQKILNSTGTNRRPDVGRTNTRHTIADIG